MSMTVVPFDYTLPAWYRDRVTHYLEHQVSGDDCNDVFSPVQIKANGRRSRRATSLRSWWSGLTGRTPE